MAMRAYLYFTDNVAAPSLLSIDKLFDREDGREREYMDSRHQTPLAWFLFFSPENVSDLDEDQGGYAALFFVREWEQAKREFWGRVPLLLSWFPGQLSHPDIENFLARVETLIAAPEEKFLVLDDRELPFIDNNVPQVRAHLELLESPLMTSREKLKKIDVWSCSRYVETELERYYKVFGYYYGGYFDE